MSTRLQWARLMCVLALTVLATLAWTASLSISFSPSSGPAGTPVTITLAGFIPAQVTSVSFNGTAATIGSAGVVSITTSVPAAASTGKIRVIEAGVTVSSSTSFTVTPTISGFSPTASLIGSIITINGTGFTGCTSVSFTGAGATTVLATSYTAYPTSIKARVPSTAIDGPITITTPGGVVSTSTFTVLHLPTIASFSPASGYIGYSITLNGTYFDSVSSVKINGTSAQYTVNSDTSITLTVPSGATSGKITVTTPGGTATSTLSYTVIQAPTITSFTPTSGGADLSVATVTVIIKGANLADTSAVQFNGTPASISATTATSVTVTVPIGATTGVITLTTPGGTASSANVFTVIPLPTIATITPAALVGQQVTITGTGFAGCSKVLFNGLPAASFTVSASMVPPTIYAKVPLGAANGPITITTPGGVTSSSTFTVLHLPTIASFSPASGYIGYSITLNGTYFDSVSSVKINGTSAQYTVNSDYSITLTVPSGATSGKITVTNSGGTATSTLSYTVIQAPTITSFTPTSGGADVSAATVTVIIKGTNLADTSAVQFNGTSATISVISATSVTVTVPIGATTGVITLTTPGGTAISANVFTVIPLPTIATITPAALEGQLVTITGTGFAGCSKVLFNGQPAASFTVYASMIPPAIYAKVPLGATNGLITITTPGGMASSTSFTVQHLPKIASFSPTSAYIGDTITLIGTYFDNASSVTVNGTIAYYTVNSASSISVVVPSGATSGKITVTTPIGMATSSSSFTVIPAPTITTFTPASGGSDISAAPVTVTITGKNFTGTTSVKFNGTSAIFSTVSDTSITATVPTGATTGVITVTTPAGPGTSAKVFTVIPLPTITSISPAAAHIGNIIIINGTSFTGCSSVLFTGAGATTVPATSFTAYPTYIRVIVPLGAINGPITITTPGGVVSGSSFTMLYLPTITSFSPTSAYFGDSITLNGTYFVGVSSVKLNGVNASYTLNSDSSITLTVPSGVTSGYITVNTTGGTATSPSGFTVLYLPPTLTSFTPETGNLNDTVTLTGTNFISASSVKFNGIAATFTVNSATSITATVPAGATTGYITVKTPGGTATSARIYTVTFNPPTLSNVSPGSGSIGTKVTLTGTNFLGTTFVLFNGTAANFTVNSDTTITTTVPTGATTGFIIVSTPGGTVNSYNPFGVNASVVITGIIPAPTAAIGDQSADTGVIPALTMPEISIRTPAPVTLSDTGATTGDFDLTFADSSIAHLPLTVIGGTGGTIVSMTDSVQLPAGNMSLALGSTTSVNFANLTIASLNMNFTVYTPVSGQVSWTLPNSYVISFNPSGSDYIIANSFLTLNWDGVTSVPPVAVGDNISVTVHFYLAGRQVASVTKLTTVTTSTTGMSAIFAGVISTQKFDTIQVTMDLTGN